MLKAVDIPELAATRSGQPYLAYDTLSDRMKKTIADLEGVHMEQETELDHSSLEASPRCGRRRRPRIRSSRVHPETGRKCLYVGDKTRLIAA